jgi:hypothetical protein
MLDDLDVSRRIRLQLAAERKVSRGVKNIVIGNASVRIGSFSLESNRDYAFPVNHRALGRYKWGQ